MDLQEQEMLHPLVKNPEGSEALSNKTGRFLNNYLLDVRCSLLISHLGDTPLLQHESVLYSHGHGPLLMAASGKYFYIALLVVRSSWNEFGPHGFKSGSPSHLLRCLMRCLYNAVNKCFICQLMHT